MPELIFEFLSLVSRSFFGFWTAAIPVLGVGVGAFATFGAVVYTHRQSTKKEEEAAIADRVRAARAWRDDFYGFQNHLAWFIAAGGKWEKDRSAWVPVATITDMLTVSAGYPDGSVWGNFSGARRRMMEALLAWEEGTSPSIEEMWLTFKFLETGRKILSQLPGERWEWKEHEQLQATKRLIVAARAKIVVRQ